MSYAPLCLNLRIKGCQRNPFSVFSIGSHISNTRMTFQSAFRIPNSARHIPHSTFQSFAFRRRRRIKSMPMQIGEHICPFFIRQLIPGGNTFNMFVIIKGLLPISLGFADGTQLFGITALNVTGATIFAE
jgi:hypothetical protein